MKFTLRNIRRNSALCDVYSKKSYDESYTSHNTTRLDVAGTVKKILTTDYVQEELKGIRHY